MKEKILSGLIALSTPEVRDPQPLPEVTPPPETEEEYLKIYESLMKLLYEEKITEIPLISPERVRACIEQVSVGSLYNEDSLREFIDFGKRYCVLLDYADRLIHFHKIKNNQEFDLCMESLFHFMNEKLYSTEINFMKSLVYQRIDDMGETQLMDAVKKQLSFVTEDTWGPLDEIITP